MENLIFEHRKRVAENIEKSFENNIEKARQVGDISSDGKKVWTEYAPGKFDWRVIKQGKATQKPTTQSDNKAEAFKRNRLKIFMIIGIRIPICGCQNTKNISKISLINTVLKISVNLMIMFMTKLSNNV